MLLMVSCSYANVYATLDDSSVGSGESVQLTIHVDNFAQQPDLSVLRNDFTIYNKGTTSKTTIVNGKRTTKYEMVVTIMPNKSGSITIPSISVGGDRTQPIVLKVQKALSTEEETKYQDVFAIGSMSNNTTYVNVPVTYTIKIYYATPLLQLKPKPWDIKKATINQVGNVKVYKKRVNGKTYDVSEESFLIIPSSTGIIDIAPIVLEATIANKFGQIGVKNKFISTDMKILNVKPIPRDISITDWFPASDVTIHDYWSQENGIKAGHLITRTVRVDVSGALSNDIPKLEFDSTDNFNVYVEKPELSDKQANGKVTSSAVYKIGYMPIKAGKATIPEVSVKWFDVDTAKSKVATISTKSFDVAKGDAPHQILNIINKTNSSADSPIVVESDFWRYIAFGFILLWLVTLVVLIKVIFSKRKIKYDAQLDYVESIDKASLKDVKKACSQKNNVLLQKNLISWAKSEYNSDVISLSDVGIFIPELTQLLKELNSAIYSDTYFDKYKDVIRIITTSKKVSQKKSSGIVIKGLYDK